ncbi:MAG: hypothetical protein Q9167_008014 [Letrouitia subvulpina]
MQYTVSLWGLLLPVALASPHFHPYGKGGVRHKVIHHRKSALSYGSGYPSGTAITLPSATSAPYELGNGTSTLGGTGTGTIGTTTIQKTSTVTDIITVTGISPDETASPVESAVPTGNDSPVGGSATNGCNAGTATVTYNPTVTVTITAAQPNTTTEASIFSFTALQSSSEVPEASETGQGESTLAALPATSTSTTAPAKSTSATNELDVSTPSSSSAPSAPASSEAVAPAGPTTSTADSVAPALPSASTAASPLAPAPTKAAGGSKKRGILASSTDQDLLVSAFNDSPKISWLCNWFSAPPGKVNPRIEFVPQNYGKQSDILPKFEWTANAKAAVAQGKKYFLSFGEPEFKDNPQLHMEPEEAVGLWMEKMQPYALQGVTVGAPAVLQPDEDLQWLAKFLDLCEAKGCKVGFVAVHWFWSASEEHVGSFKETVDKAVAIAKGKGLKVWVDNFQATGTDAAQRGFLEGVLPWLEGNEAVERYAYVSPERSTGTGLLKADGKLSELGEFYANF